MDLMDINHSLRASKTKMEGILLGLLLLGCITAGAGASCILSKVPMTLTQWSGNIQSPNYDEGMYPNNQDCTWNIRVNTGSKIQLTFSVFKLEAGRFINRDPSKRQEKCSDYVRITEGGETLFDGCGEKKPDKLTSNTNNVTVQFVSDESGQPEGFSLQYTGIPSDTVEAGTVIETPGYPDEPPVGQIFEWKVPANPNGINIIRGNAISDTLPLCGESPIYVEDQTNKMWNKELCLSDYATFGTGDQIIIYNGSAGAKPWTGRLNIESADVRANCKLLCDNSTNNLKNCIDARDMTGRFYTCECNDEYDGRHCEALKSVTEPCYSSPCINEGICSPGDRERGDAYICACPTAYTGTHCETEINECLGVTCQNGGVCKTGSCSCIKGYAGKFCGIDINECEPNPCQNGGSCEDLVGSFTCKCIRGFKGDRCQIPFKDCDWLPCHNGGTCIQDDVDFTCTCTPEFTGMLCAIPIDSAHCLQQQDTEFGSELVWKDTLAGDVDIQPCPPGILGNATRMCVHDMTSPTNARWTRPDLGDCVSPKLINIRGKAMSLVTDPNVNSSAIEDITRELANATSIVQDSQGALLYPGDLVFSTGVVEIVSMAVAKAPDIMDRMQTVAELFGEAVDNIVDPATVIVWRNTKISMIGEKVSSLLLSTEMLAQTFTERHHRWRRAVATQPDREQETLNVVTRNLEFRVSELSKDPSKPRLPVYKGSVDGSSIQLPTAVADIAMAKNGDTTFDVYYAKFKSVSTLLSMKEDRHNGSDPASDAVINSDVVSGRVLGMSDEYFRSLNQSVIITLALKDIRLRENLTEYCVFMNMSAMTGEKRWLTEGCVLYDVNQSHVVCHCNHLTNFALLMDVYGTSETLDDSNSQALSYISYIGGSLSILACLVTIIVFQYFRLRSDRVRIHQQLAACIICVQVVFLVGFNRTQSTDTPTWACRTVAILLHYFLTALFCWMLVEGIHLYVALVKVFQRGSHIRKYLAIGWGVPVVIVGISVGVFFNSYGTGSICWLNNEMLLVCFVPTVGLVVLINTVILGMVLRVMLKSLHSSAKVTSPGEEKSGLWMSLKAAAVLLPLLGLTWTLAFLSVDTPGSKVLGYVFTYLFTICNSFQGVVFFVFHCLLNADVHSAYERRYKKRKRLMTMTSNDISTLKQKRSSSEQDTYFHDSPSRKSSVDKTFADLSFVERRPSNPYSDVYPRHERGNSPVEDYDMSDKEQIWRRYSAHQEVPEDSYPRHFRSINSYSPDYNHFVNNMDTEGKSSMRFN